MIQVPMKTEGPLNKQTVLSINQKRIQGPKTSQDIYSINAGSTSRPRSSSVPQPRPSSPPQPRPSATVPQNTVTTRPIPQKPIPTLMHPMRKGEKISLESNGTLAKVKACLGWNVTNNACDVDVSAFLLNESGRVLGDTWFVFYGQTISPDGSTVFSADSNTDRETISIDFQKLNSKVQKIVFVLTINEALEKRLNFSMLKDAYIRMIDQTSGQELASFQMDEYYSNVTSMMIGEVYKHKNIWKFNAIGNGVAKDLAGLCALYGVLVE